MLNLNCTEGPLSFFHTQIELPFYCIVYLIKETNVNWWQILSLHSLVSLCFSFFFPITLPFNLFIFVYETTNIVGLFLTRVFFQNACFFHFYVTKGPSWPTSHGIWVYTCIFNQCISSYHNLCWIDESNLVSP